MDDKAIIEGVYVDLKFLPGLKSSRISIDIPIEYSNRFLKMFDAPDRANPVRVAVARLGTAEPLPSAPEGAPEGKPDRTYTRSQVAALKLQDKDFLTWLNVNYDDPEHLGADGLLKRLLRIQSKKELDTDPIVADRWQRLLTDFDNRAHIR